MWQKYHHITYKLLKAVTVIDFLPKPSTFLHRKIQKNVVLPRWNMQKKKRFQEYGPQLKPYESSLSGNRSIQVVLKQCLWCMAEWRDKRAYSLNQRSFLNGILKTAWSTKYPVKLTGSLELLLFHRIPWPRFPYRGSTDRNANCDKCCGFIRFPFPSVHQVKVFFSLYSTWVFSKVALFHSWSRGLPRNVSNLFKVIAI